MAPTDTSARATKAPKRLTSAMWTTETGLVAAWPPRPWDVEEPAAPEAVEEDDVLVLEPDVVDDDPVTGKPDVLLSRDVVTVELTLKEVDVEEVTVMLPRGIPLGSPGVIP